MFHILLKEKIQLESKIKELEFKYFELKRQQISNQNADAIEKSSIISPHLSFVRSIKKDYSEFVETSRVISSELKSANYLNEKFDSELNEIAEKFGIELPEELKNYNQKHPEENQENQNIENTPTVQNPAFEEDQSEENKENTLNNFELDSDNFDLDSYSPQVFINKTPGLLSDTPAFKTTKKQLIRSKCLQD